MPELPDLQVFSRNLNKKLAGKTLKKISINKGARINVSNVKLKNAVEGRKLVKVYREGKELHFFFSNKTVLGIHLMLRGKLYWFEEKNTHSHTLAEFHFNNIGLAFTDYQRKATITLNPPETDVPDALSKDVNLRFWKKVLQSKAAIKNLLLDQHVVRGIGNAYADEILWKAGVSPFSKSDKIPPNKIKSLFRAVTSVLKNAEKQISKTDPSIIGGEMRDFLAIHNPAKKKSPNGSTIKHTTGSRKTYYTEEQTLFK